VDALVAFITTVEGSVLLIAVAFVLLLSESKAETLLLLPIVVGVGVGVGEEDVVELEGNGWAPAVPGARFPPLSAESVGLDWVGNGVAWPF
jgi:hypothetical protein